MTGNSEKKREPELRFSEFIGALKEQPIGSVAEIIGGYAFSSSGMSPKKRSYQLVKMSNLYKGEFDLTRNPSYWNEINTNSSKYLIKDLDILITLTGTVGKRDFGYTVLVSNPKNLLLNQRVGLIRAIDGQANHRFIYYLTQTQLFSSRFHHLAIGGTGNQANVSILDCKRIRVFIPDEEGEQRKIADFLGAVDAKLDALRRKRALLAEYKRGVMQKLFKQEIRFVGDGGRPFPVWERKSLRDIGITVSDGNYGELYPKADQFVKDGIPFIRANNMKDGRITWSDMRFISEDLHSILTSGHLKDKDVLVSTRGDIGIISIVDSEFVGANINAQICLLRDSNLCEQIFLFYSLATSDAKKQFIRLTTGSALKQLPRKNLLRIEIGIPSVKEQQKIANFLTAIDNKITAVYQQIEQMETFKRVTTTNVCLRQRCII